MKTSVPQNYVSHCLFFFVKTSFLYWTFNFPLFFLIFSHFAIDLLDLSIVLFCCIEVKIFSVSQILQFKYII